MAARIIWFLSYCVARSRELGALFLVLLALPHSAASQSPAESVPPPSEILLERFGKIALAWPLTPQKPAALMLLMRESADDATARNLAERFALEGALVATIDWKTYLGDQAEVAGKCVQFWDLERLGQVIQSQLQLPEIQVPLLAGIGPAGSAATAAFVTYPDRFRGALTLGDSTSFATNNPPCERTEAVTFDATHHQISASVPTPMPNTFLAFSSWPPTSTLSPPADDSARIKRWFSDTAITPPKPNELEQYIGLSSPPMLGSSAPLIIFASGDGGWAAIDKQITARFVERGFGVLGINSLRYFWRPRTPREFAKFLSRLLAAKTQRWTYSNIILAGFSLGADVMPATVREAPADLAHKVAAVVLLSPSKYVEFEVHLTDWLGLGGEPQGRPIAEDLASITQPVLCLSGEDEREGSGCPQATPLIQPKAPLGGESSRLTSVVLSGGHHFDEDYATIADRIIDWWKLQSATAP